MPRHQQRHTISRQRPISCKFCRSRKLRCSREGPCSNCVSRGLPCELRPSTEQSSGASPKDSGPEIVDRLHRLEKLLLDQKAQQEEARSSRTQDVPTSLYSESPSTHQAASPPMQGLVSDMTELETSYNDRDGSQGRITSNNVTFLTCPIQHIAGAKPYIYDTGADSSTPTGEPLRCIWLPQHAEARILLEKFVRDVNHVHHVTHVPSLPSIVDQIYDDMKHQRQPKLGNMVLLLSIFASATHSWIRRDCETSRLFTTSKEANIQAPMWMRTTQDLLDLAHRSTRMSIEGIQGLVILAFVMTNFEGISRGMWSLYGMALFFARDLGLHRIDHPSNARMANTAQAEIGRRVWWYLCASDWKMAAKFAAAGDGVYSCHPRQMITRKPLNINDEDIYDGMSSTEQPLSHPTAMSYSLQRIRLGEICRNIVDRSPLVMARLGGPTWDDVMDIDTQLQMLINDVPSFFSMSKTQLVETYQLDSVQADNILRQKYMVYLLLYAQRCKIHLPYFTRGFVDTAYFASREICVKSARLIIQCELELESSGLGTATRFTFSGVLMGLHMASFVLLMDLCINRSSPDHEKRQADVAEAFRILEEAKKESGIATKFVDLLMQILRKHKVSPPKAAASLRRGTDRESIAVDVSRQHERSQMRGNRSSNVLGYNGSTSIDDAIPPDESSNAGEDLSSYFNDFVQGFDQGADLNTLDWDSLMSGEMSFF